MSIIVITLSLSQTLRARGRLRRLVIWMPKFLAIFGQVTHGEYTIFIALVNIQKWYPSFLQNEAACTLKELQRYVFLCKRNECFGPLQRHCMCSIIWATNSNQIICIKGSQNYIYPFQNHSLGFILKILLKFANFSLDILIKYILIKKKECNQSPCGVAKP